MAYPPARMHLQPATRLALELREQPTKRAVASAAWRLAFGKELKGVESLGDDHATEFLSAVVDHVELGISEHLPRLGLAVDTWEVAESVADALVPELPSRREAICDELGVYVPGDPIVGEVLYLIARHVAATVAEELLPIARVQRGGSSLRDAREPRDVR